MNPGMLGRQAPSPRRPTDFTIHDFVDVERVKAIAAALQPWPFKLGDIILSHYRSQWPMFANDRLGDCVAAGAFHLRQAWDALSRRADVGFTDEQAIALYALSGYDPATGANDNGWTLAACLDVMRKQGVLLQNAPDIQAWARVDPSNDDAVESAHFLFGGVYGGAALPADAQGQYTRGEVWVPTSGPGGQPDSWGGHCMARIDRRRASDTAGWITWGGVQRVTRGWEYEYVDEMFAGVPTDWETRVPYLARHNLVDFPKLSSLLSGVGQVQG